jgi:hypothetical protein
MEIAVGAAGGGTIAHWSVLPADSWLSEPRFWSPEHTDRRWLIDLFGNGSPASAIVEGIDGLISGDAFVYTTDPPRTREGLRLLFDEGGSSFRHELYDVFTFATSLLGDHLFLDIFERAEQRFGQIGAQTTTLEDEIRIWSEVLRHIFPFGLIKE